MVMEAKSWLVVDQGGSLPIHVERSDGELDVYLPRGNRGATEDFRLLYPILPVAYSQPSPWDGKAIIDFEHKIKRMVAFKFFYSDVEQRTNRRPKSKRSSC